MALTISMTLINYFQLKIAGIAAIQRCKNREEEMKTIKQIKWAMLIYLPVYGIISAVQYTAQSFYLYGLDDKSAEYKRKCGILIITFDSTKFLLTSGLFIVSMRFAS